MRKWYGRDRGLTTRMGLTIFGLGLVYVLFIGAMIAAGVGAITILVIAGGFAVAQLLFGDKIALASMRAKVTTPEEQPELHAMIERLCQLADIPKPRVAVSEMDMPNAFAAGPQPQDRDGVRHHRPDAAPGAARAGGRDRPRALPHRQQGRHRDDGRRVPGDGRRPVRALRDLQRDERRARPRQQRRRVLRRHPGLGRGVRGVVPAAAGPVALPRVRGRPRRGDHDRGAGAARRGAPEDLRDHDQDPDARPARRRGDERLLHHAGRGARASRSRASSPPTPRRRSASSGSWPCRRRSTRRRARHSRPRAADGPARRPARPARAQARQPRPPLRARQRRPHAPDVARDRADRAGGRVLQADRRRPLRRDPRARSSSS